ncbi:MAG TPA: hypothetical protein VKP30_13405 [Polyangiaceae bacterium]|nr:hypothetical protein [Polyangiaceae bacterium]
MVEQPSTAIQFDSKLTDGRQRFLAFAIEHALLSGRRSAHDFIRHFPPELIMEGMAEHPELRAEILAQTTGLKFKIAAKKAWQSAADDLRIALTEGETKPEIVMSVFAPDDRVRYLDARRLWLFLSEGEFWNVAPKKAEEHRIAKQHIAFLLDRALIDNLVTHRAVIEGITVAELATRLPKAELGKIIEGALAAGQKRSPFTEVELWSALTAQVLVEYVPLSHLWHQVLLPKVAETHGYVAESPTVPPNSPEKPETWVEIPDEPHSTTGEVISEDDFA